MSVNTQPQSRTALNPIKTVKYQFVWQETSTAQSELVQGDIIISVTDITTIGLASGPQILQYMALAKLKWDHWEANFGCTYYPVPSIFLDFKCLRMNDAMRNEVQGGDFARGRGRKDRWDDVEPKIRTAPADDRNNWMLKVTVGDAVGTEEMGHLRQIRGVTLWAKRVVDDEEVKLSRAEKERLQLV